MIEASTLQRRLVRYMADRGLKQTRQRQVIFDAFLACGRHVAIDELLVAAQENMPGLGYATVYRAVKLFSEAGVANVLRLGDGQTRYEPADADEHHDHLICRTCGHIFEFEDPVIEAHQRAIAERHGLRIRSHHLDIFGDCMQPDSCPRLAAAS